MQIDCVLPHRGIGRRDLSRVVCGCVLRHCAPRSAGHRIPRCRGDCHGHVRARCRCAVPAVDADDRAAAVRLVLLSIARVYDWVEVLTAPPSPVAQGSTSPATQGFSAVPPPRARAQKRDGASFSRASRAMKRGLSRRRLSCSPRWRCGAAVSPAPRCSRPSHISPSIRFLRSSRSFSTAGSRRARGLSLEAFSCPTTSRRQPLGGAGGRRLRHANADRHAIRLAGAWSE